MRAKKTERFSSIFLCLLLLLTFLPVSGYSAVPQTINYQGYLTDTSGNPVDTSSQGPIQMTISIYNVANPNVTTPLWSETHNSVEVNHGVYSIILGSINPLNILFEQPMYLGVRVGTDLEMIPRQVLTSVPFAINADTVDSMHADEFAPSSHSHSGADISSGKVLDAYIDPSISRNSELTAHTSRGDNPHGVTAEQVGISSSAHDHDTRYYTQSQVDTIIAAQNGRIADLESLLVHFTKNGNEIYIDGANLHVRSGVGSTDGVVNGLGNIIIGYNELRTVFISTCSLGQYTSMSKCKANGGTWAKNHKSGSHNLVIGANHNYSRYGGLIVGYQNTISGISSSISGGQKNMAFGDNSSVSGGESNLAKGNGSSISGGSANTASGDVSSVSGGDTNIASGDGSSVSGGHNNEANGFMSSIAGGGGFTYGNSASGDFSTISGGDDRSVAGLSDWRAGELFQEN